MHPDEVELVRRPHQVVQRVEVAADDRCADPAWRDRPDVLVVRPARNLADATLGEAPRTAESRVNASRSVAPNDPKPGPWKVQRPAFFSSAACRFVTSLNPMMALGFVGHQVVVDERQHLDRAGPAPQAEDDVDLVIEQEGMQVVDPRLRRPGDVVLTRPDAVGQPHLVAARRPPLDRTQDVAAVLVGAGGCEDPDRPTRRQRPSEPRRLHVSPLVDHCWSVHSLPTS